MASAIARRTFVLSPTTDVYLKSDGATSGYVRVLGVGSDWTWIRVGAQFAITTDGTNNLTGGILAISINSTQASAWPFAASPINSYFGIMLAGGDTFTYNAGGGNPYFTSTRTFSGKKIGATQTLETADTTDTFYPTNTGSTQRRGIMYCDFDKSIGSAQMYLFSTASHVQVDYSEADFLAGLAYEGTPTIGGNLMHKTSFAIPGTTDTGGALDTVCWYFGTATAPFAELYNIAVYRFV